MSLASTTYGSRVLPPSAARAPRSKETAANANTSRAALRSSRTVFHATSMPQRSANALVSSPVPLAARAFHLGMCNFFGPARGAQFSSWAPRRSPRATPCARVRVGVRRGLEVQAGALRHHLQPELVDGLERLGGDAQAEGVCRCFWASTRACTEVHALQLLVADVRDTVSRCFAFRRSACTRRTCVDACGGNERRGAEAGQRRTTRARARFRFLSNARFRFRETEKPHRVTPFRWAPKPYDPIY